MVESDKCIVWLIQMFYQIICSCFIYYYYCIIIIITIIISIIIIIIIVIIIIIINMIIIICIFFYGCWKANDLSVGWARVYCKRCHVTYKFPQAGGTVRDVDLGPRRQTNERSRNILKNKNNHA